MDTLHPAPAARASPVTLPEALSPGETGAPAEAGRAISEAALQEDQPGSRSISAVLTACLDLLHEAGHCRDPARKRQLLARVMAVLGSLAPGHPGEAPAEGRHGELTLPVPSEPEATLRLTLRQRQIMALVLDGQPSKNIAADLNISRRTVENHRAAIMRRTGATSLPALARIVVGSARHKDCRLGAAMARCDR